MTELSSILLHASELQSIEAIRDYLKPHYEYLVGIYEEDYLLIEEDYSTGSDVYGYESLESICYNLSYISDKWGCCFRLRWLIELINPQYILWGDQDV